jgi:hypothetical protein
VNLAKLRGCIHQAVTSPSPFRLAEISVWTYRRLYPHPDAVSETDKLEVRIADDFDDLPEHVAEEFWADTLNANSEHDDEGSENA